MLRGRARQAAEGGREAHRMAGDEVKPEVVLLTNALLSGVIPEFEERLSVPVFVTLQGDDIFLDALPEADRRACCGTDPRQLRRRRRVHLHEPLLRRLHGRLPRHAA